MKVLAQQELKATTRRSHSTQADTGIKEGVENWCLYVLKGLKDEIEKIDRLLDYDFLKVHILLPAINFSLERKLITETETKVLKRAADLQLLQAKDLKDIFVGKHGSEISRQIAKLLEKKMLKTHHKYPRKYMLRFDNSYLLRGIIGALGDKGFLPEIEHL